MSSPVWSGIGHSTDRTLIDEVAAKSFKTPSDVAHQVVQITADLINSSNKLLLDAARCAQRLADQATGQQQNLWPRVVGSALSVVDKAESNFNRCARAVEANAKLITQSWQGRLYDQKSRAWHCASASISKMEFAARNVVHLARAQAHSTRGRWNDLVGIKRRDAFRCGQACIEIFQQRLATAIQRASGVNTRLSILQESLCRSYDQWIKVIMHTQALLQNY